jgi:multimeric flavodoxin WrbA
MKEVKGMAKKNKATKVLVLLGSPRKHGNSALLAEAITKGAESRGAEVETVFIQGKKIEACTSCYHCQKKGSKGCSIHDDMQSIYKKLIAAQAWVIASPVYWFTMSAQTKLWMDRLFALPAYAKHPFSGKRIAIAMSYGGADPFDSGCINALRTFQDAFSYTESNLVGMVYGSAMGAGEIKSDKTLMKAAEELGRKLIPD